MVKKRIALVLSLGALMAMSHVSSPFAHNGMKESAEDYAANRGVGLHVLRAEGAGFEYSQTFVQSGVNESGEDVLRFATAVKGNVESLSYTRFALDGAPAGSAQAKENVVPVTTLYRSIEVSDGSAYYNGEKVVNEATEATEGWYWACYSITYTSSTFKASDVRVQLTVNESEALEERSTSLNKVKLPNLEEYIVDGVGNKYSGSYVSLEVVDKYTAKATYSGFEVEASVTGEEGEYLVFGDSEMGFKASFSKGTSYTKANVSVKDFMYNGENKINLRDGYSAEVLDHISSFYMEYYKDLNTGYARVDTSRPNEVFAPGSLTLYLRNLPSGVSVSAKSSDDSVVAATASSSEVKVEYKKGGYAKVTVTAKDAYGTSKSLDVEYNVTEAVYPTEEDFDIIYTVVGGEKFGDLKVNNQAQFEVVWKDNGKINQPKNVKWSSEDTKIASISNASDQFGVLSAKKAGTVNIYATVTGANGEIKKPFSLTISEYEEGEEAGFPADIVGVWDGTEDQIYWNTFTFTVKSDGTAVLEVDTGDSFNFTCHEEDHKLGDTQYNFESDDYPGCEVQVWSIRGKQAYICFEDCEFIDDVCDTYLCYATSLDIYKR
ncbi:MAG: Ig-like domain-containing protein [Erysipelotrichales bacterium]|nr:Ig-like domain-containing protein [Erysipelotrichales bacterium]